MTQARTLYDKIWDDHVVDMQEDGTGLLYIDRHLVHEVTSPQAFEGLRMTGRKVRQPQKTLAVVDHNVPTTDRSHGIDDPESALQVETLAKNAADFDVEYFNELDHRQGIVHIVGPEQGFTLPGMTIVCGDSHTSTHGAFGALAFKMSVRDGASIFHSTEADNIVKHEDMETLAYSWEQRKLAEAGRIEWTEARDLVLWCLQADPERRPQSFEDVLRHRVLAPVLPLVIHLLALLVHRFQLGARPLLPAQQRADRERHDEDEEADGEEDDERDEEGGEHGVDHQ